MSARDPRMARLRRATEALERWGARREWLGADPYDALNGRRVPRVPSPLGRRAVIQLVKRSPLDLRRALGIEPRHNSATIAHLLTAYSHGAAPDPEGRSRWIRWCVERLSELRLEGWPGAAWGYHFDVETRFFFYASTTPNTIATSFAGLALLDAHALGGDAAAGSLELAVSAGEFLLAGLERTPGEGGAYFGYFPGDRTPIHNASLLACGLLARLGAATGRDEFLAAARDGLGFALAHQRDDGSWPYAEGPSGGWIDGWHTGYVLDSLLRCAEPLGDPRIPEAWSRGLSFYDRRLFDPDGAPRFTAESRWPIDGACVAQAIETFSRAAAIDPGSLERAWRTFEFAEASMRRADGAYLFQRGRRWVNRVAHVRWVQAPMLAALCLLAEAAGATIIPIGRGVD